MRHRNLLVKIAGCMLMMLCFFAVIPQQAHAATEKLTVLKPGHTYKSYDVTGDNKKDKIIISKIKTEKNVPASMAAHYVDVKIGGKNAFTIYSYNGFDIRVYHKGKKGVLLSREYAATAGNGLYLYSKQSGRYQGVRLSKNMYGVTKFSLKNKQLVVKGYQHIGRADSFTLKYKLSALRKML